MTEYNLLVSAILQHAIREYRQQPTDDLLRFFHSDWCELLLIGILPGYDPEALIAALDLPPERQPELL